MADDRRSLVLNQIELCNASGVLIGLVKPVKRPLLRVSARHSRSGRTAIAKSVPFKEL